MTTSHVILEIYYQQIYTYRRSIARDKYSDSQKCNYILAVLFLIELHCIATT